MFTAQDNAVASAPVASQPKNRLTALLILAVVLIVLGNLGAYFIQTGGGQIQVVGLKFPTENGQWVTADLFRPKSATETNPAPVVVVCPGFERSKETMDAYSIELARRGLVVIVIDPYNQGASSSTAQRRSATVEGYGVVPVVEYIHDTPNLNYVDRKRIGAVGYSAGGNAVLQSVSRFGGRQAKALKTARRKDSDGGQTVTDAELAQAQGQNKLAAVFVGGYVLTMTADVLETVDANLGMDYACYDEGAFRTEKGHAFMREAPEALRFVNSALPQDQQVAAVEMGRLYGDAAKRTLRVVHNTKSIHPIMTYDATHIANMVEFFAAAFQLKPALPATQQVWLRKEFCTLLALAGAFLFLIPFASLLLRLPCFQPLVHAPAETVSQAGRNGKALYWAIFVFGMVVACFLFMPCARATAVLFPQASDRMQTWWFPQRINNAILLWAVANGLIGLCIFFAHYLLHARKQGATLEKLGLRVSAKELALTFGLALLVFGAFYALVFLSYAVFHTDFRFMFVSAPASFPVKMWLVALEYIPLFFIFYLANSIRVNCTGQFLGRREWVRVLVNALGNSVGLLLLLGIQYSALASTGKVFWTEEWLYVNLLLGVTPMMFLLPIFNRFFFHLTGRVYLGPMVTCLVFVMMMLTSNVCYIPLR